MNRTVMLVTPYWPPDGGGLERYAHHIATRLTGQHHWRIVVVTSGGRRARTTRTMEDGLTIYRLGYDFKLSNSVFGLRWGKKLKAIIRAEQPVLINAHMPTPGLADVAARVSGDLPFILTYHTGSMKKGNFLVDLLIGAYEKFQLPRIIKRADTVVCSSDFVRDVFLCRYHHKTITITPGVDEKLFHPRHSAHKPGSQMMLFVGNYGPSYRHKGLADAVEALGLLHADHPNLELHVAGTGDNQTYQAQARRLGVASKLKFLGWHDMAGLANLYPHADAVVLPSKTDSFPMVLVDAMACGVPVVSTTVGGIPTVIDHGRTGLLVPPEQPAALAAALSRILGDSAYATKLGRAGRAEVLDRLTWTQKAADTNELFERALIPHVCQISAYYPPHLGGVENMVQELSRHLAGAGHTVDVVTSRLAPAGGQATTQPPATPGVTVRRLPGFEVLHTPVLPRLLRTLLDQPHGTVYHLHVAQAGLPECTYLAAKLRHRRYIAHVHLDVDPSGLVGRLILGPYKRLVLRRVLRAADRVVALSADQATHLARRYGLDPRRVAVVPNGVAPEYFRPARDKFHHPLRILFVGRLAIQKRPERIVAAMKRLPKAHLEVVGDGPDRAQLQALADRDKLTNVTFRGPLYGAELRAAYQDADVLVLPSDKEGMPLTLLEAMAAGLPIVGSNVTGIRELINGVGVLVDQPSPDSFANALKPFMNRPQKLAPLSAASRQAAAGYSWDGLTARVIELYSEVRP